MVLELLERGHGNRGNDRGVQFKTGVWWARQAVGMGRHAYVLVNNRAEGNAPSTVEALVGMLRG